MEKVLIDRLLSVSVITDVVGQAIRPGLAAKSDALPYIVLSRVSGGPINTLSGTTSSFLTTIQIDCIAASYSVARSLADACTGALSGWRDINATPRIDMVHLEDETDDDFSPTDGGDYPIHRVIQTYHVSYYDTGV